MFNSFTLAVVFLTFVFLFSVASGKTCETDACKRLSNNLKVMIDNKADPCDDFSAYICGNMDKLYSIPAGETSYSASGEVASAVTNELKELLENQPLTNLSMPQTKAAIFYKSCLNLGDRNKETNPTILEFLKHLTKDKEHENNLINLLKSGMGTRFVSIENGQDSDNPQIYNLNIGKPSLILSEGTLQSDQSATGKEQIDSYAKFMNKVLDVLGLWKNNRTIVNEIIQLHIRLAKSLPSIADQSDPDKYTNKLTIKQMQSNYSEISWLNLINGAIKETGKQLKENDKIMVFSLDYLKAMNSIYREYKNDPTKKEILKMDLMWAMIVHAVPLGSGPLLDASDEFEKETMGTTGKKDLWKKCVDITSQTLSEIMGNMYVKVKFAPSQKKDIEFMIKNIKGALKGVIEKVTWMDSKTKESALIKLKAIVNKIGYPDSLLSEEKLAKTYSKVQVKENKFMENYIKYQEFSFAESMKTIGEKIPTDVWSMGSHEVNAYYNPMSNEIVFPAAILRFPYYDIGLPITYNYGAIGMVVGHEILHGFDTSGSKYDAKGYLRDWWTKSSKDEYLTKTNCIVDQYGKYSIYNQTLPSDQTVGEDIADNAGSRMSHIAVNSKSETREKLTLPGLNFTSEQLFFVGEANAWCSIFTKNALLETMKGDVHTIWKYRIDGPLSNMPEFSKAFNCDRNKKMNRLKKCLVW